MTERNASVVRNISLLLRPTMLDDLGLVPALKWYARDARHSGAHQVRIRIQGIQDREKPGAISLSVQDDGKGFDPLLEAGLGILGMRERVSRLGGTLEVNSRSGSGTILTVSLPVPADRHHAEHRSPSEVHEIRPFRTA
jgi:signal transduction histidine kinase